MWGVQYTNLTTNKKYIMFTRPLQDSHIHFYTIQRKDREQEVSVNRNLWTACKQIVFFPHPNNNVQCLSCPY